MESLEIVKRPFYLNIRDDACNIAVLKTPNTQQHPNTRQLLTNSSSLSTNAEREPIRSSKRPRRRVYINREETATEFTLEEDVRDAIGNVE